MSAYSNTPIVMARSVGTNPIDIPVVNVSAWMNVVWKCIDLNLKWDNQMITLVARRISDQYDCTIEIWPYVKAKTDTNAVIESPKEYIWEVLGEFFTVFRFLHRCRKRTIADILWCRCPRWCWCDFDGWGRTGCGSSCRADSG